MKKFIVAICLVLSGCAGLDPNYVYTEQDYRNIAYGQIIANGISNTARMNANMINQQYMVQQQQYNQQLQTNRILHQQQWNVDRSIWNNGYNY